ncbi:MAG: hypothetical protein R3C05_09925 [Pirellulaceae bacterium]
MTKTNDADSNNELSSLLLGRVNTPLRLNRNEKGVSILTKTSGSLREVASRRDGEFTFDAGRSLSNPPAAIWVDAFACIDEQLYPEVCGWRCKRLCQN